MKTLIEQLHINDAEIGNRKILLGFTIADEKVLHSCRELIALHINDIVDDFYIQQTKVDEIRRLIGDADTLKRLHSAQRNYIVELFDGVYDIDYVGNRLRIGMVHKRIGVEPKLYLSAVKTLKTTIFTTLDKHIPDKIHLQKILDSLDKLLYFDTTLIFDTYIRALLSEVESAKDRVQSYASDLEIKVAERTRELVELSQIDSLTGLLNRRAMGEQLRREYAIAKRQTNMVSIAYLDIDNFKTINDTRGHIAGDQVLKNVANAMKVVCREIDSPCRCGGDEFCIIFHGSDLQNVNAACTRLIEELIKIEPDVTLSIGVAQTGTTEFCSAEELMRNADKKMYEAKQTSGNSICI
jgi:diguanylate cyclase (GGDEF)-like protein